jgi:hypothetical protein
MFKIKPTKEFLSILFVFGFTLFVFRGYLSGEVAPPWDFFGDYFTQAFSWWDLGSFFQPTTYMPYLISGYPAHIGLQFSSFYLPVGFIAEVFEYTILNAARLQLELLGSMYFAGVGKYQMDRQSLLPLVTCLAQVSFQMLHI